MPTHDNSISVDLAYGRTGLNVTLPEQRIAKILRMNKVPSVSQPMEAVAQSLCHPIGFDQTLTDLARNHTTVCILICDITRPVPNKIILPPILNALAAAGIRRENISLLIATGIHRPNLDHELIELVGEDIVGHYTIYNHFSRDLSAHTFLGQSSTGTAVWIDWRYLQADFKIATGFIEPHLMAGFSGGRKLIVPGISSIETMKFMHGPKIMEHPQSREGVIDGNPFHEEALEIANMAGVDFIVNVALNEKRDIIGIFSGHLEAAHRAGVEFVREVVRDTLPAPVDIVITTAAGYPLDTTYYQSIKGLTAAMPIVKQGGTIILAAQCENGLGSEEFAGLARDPRVVEEIIEEIISEKSFVIDQWQFEKFAQAFRKAEIMLVADGLSPEVKNQMHVNWAATVEEALARALAKHGDKATIAVIPKGPYILAQIE